MYIKPLSYNLTILYSYSQEKYDVECYTKTVKKPSDKFIHHFHHATVIQNQFHEAIVD